MLKALKGHMAFREEILYLQYVFNKDLNIPMDDTVY